MKISDYLFTSKRMGFKLAYLPRSGFSGKGLTFLLVACSLIYHGCATQPKPSTYMKAQMPVTVYGEKSGLGRPRNIWHTVGPSETLWRVSKTYEVDMQTLMSANKLKDPGQIKKGQRLLIPQTQGAIRLIPLYPNRRWTHIVIHHTATDAGNAFAIDELHHKRGFWNGLGYHFLIDNGTDGTEDGQIEVGPRWVKQMVGAHANANGMNEHGIGISLVGNFSERHVTEKELESLVFLVRKLQEYYHIPKSNVIGHRNVPGKHTECPGNNFPWERFKAML